MSIYELINTIAGTMTNLPSVRYGTLTEQNVQIDYENGNILYVEFRTPAELLNITNRSHKLRYTVYLFFGQQTATQDISEQVQTEISFQLDQAIEFIERVNAYEDSTLTKVANVTSANFLPAFQKFDALFSGTQITAVIEMDKKAVACL